jgi:superfamily II DNA or RNA helicase
MILTFCGHNYSLLQVTNALPDEMNAIKAAVTARVNKFQRRGHANWNGDICLCWWVEPYFYVPAGCWKRLYDLRFPDAQAYRPAYTVEFRNQDKFFNKTLDIEEVKSFVDSLHPVFDDVTDQVTVLYYILMYRMSSHNIATGFGKTYLSYLLAQWTSKVFEGKTLMIVPRTALVAQGIDDFNNYMKTIDADDRLKLYGICGGFRNYMRFEDANCYIGTYQSLSNMPDDMFKDITTVICDEGHTAKAMSVKECVSKCINAQIITAISGTIKYSQDADSLTIEQFCGPLITDYSAHQQIEKGRLPKIAMQQIMLKYAQQTELYKALLQAQRLPLPTRNSRGKATYPPELAATYRSVEFQFLWSNEHLMNYILALAKNITDTGRNVLIIFANRQPAINIFEYANSLGRKCHLILGGTPTQTRQEIKGQIEREGGWILSATVGCMSMGVSINNLAGIIMCMIGHSPHVVLQSIGRMLRNHKDKFAVTVCYDIINDISSFGTNFDVNNGAERLQYYKTEEHPVYEMQTRNADDY